MIAPEEVRMGDLIRFGVSTEDDLLESFDRLSAERGYTNRSEALRDLMRDALVQARVEGHPTEAEVLGSLTLVYDHHARELGERMAALQHDHHSLVVSVLHVHISHDDCLELIALRGRAAEVRTLADALLSLKGVKHGRLFLTLPAGDIGGRAGRRHRHSRARAPQS
jgi:CopG family transcriptional regulator, nickel-responsive regulator